MIEDAIGVLYDLHFEGCLKDHEYKTIHNALTSARNRLMWKDAHREPPEKSGAYLTYDERGKIEICQYDKKAGRWFYGTFDGLSTPKPYGYKSEAVEYWRLLPDVPCSD